MAGLRKGRSYRKVKRAYTRKSKFKTKAFIKAIPPHKIAKFKMGDLLKKFNYIIENKKDKFDNTLQEVIKIIEKENF